MLNQDQIQQIYKWWHVFKNDGNLVEIRCIGDKVTYSGYYKNINNLLRDVSAHDDVNIYFTINPINESCHGRPQCEQMLRNPKNATVDAEIIGREWVFIDFDCEKVTNVNSTEEEKEFAHQKALQVYRYLKQHGFSEPVIVDSANGFHAYIRCSLAPTEENDLLISRFLKSLAMLFSDEHVSIDVKTANRARVAKLPGTFSRKGSALSDDRPQRMCKIIKVPSEIIPTSKDYFKSIADLFPEEVVKPSAHNNYSTEPFDLPKFLSEHNINYKTENVAGGTKYILDHCLFDESHKGKDAVIFQRENGAIAYHCFHSHCEHFTWRDARLKIDPHAYDKKDYQEFQHKQRYFSRYEPVPVEIKKENEQDGKKWLSLKDVQRIKDEDLIAIPTGIFMLDRAIKGLILGEISILSGINASGKTSFINTLLLNAVQKGFVAGLWSGELQASRLKGWIYQTAAGKANVEKVVGSEKSYETVDRVVPMIDEWLDKKLYVYNNNYGSKWKQLLTDITECIDTLKAQFIVLDNLMAMSLEEIAGDKNEKQKQFILELAELAKQKNIHILVVAHPRKEANNTLLRKESISGTSDLTNVVHNLFLIHRITQDFSKRACEFWGKEKTAELCLYDNVIEVAKNRAYGYVDYTVGLYYETETRRFKNNVSEYIHYGWEPDNGYQQYVGTTSNYMPINYGFSSQTQITDTHEYDVSGMWGDDTNDIPY